jgi:hypothetical protein
MKVFITGTPAVEIKLINAVVDLLSKVKGPISYHAIEPLEKESVQLVVRQFDEDGIKTEKLEFDELINISQLYRLKYNVDKDDDLVILTSIQMVHQFNANSNKNWFSYYRGNNIVIKTIGWERFVDNKMNVAISHQVIENLFQTLLGESFTGFHMESKSCINDFCENEIEITYKLMSCRICNDCLNAAFERDIKLEILDQIRESLNLLRERFQIFESLDEKIKEESANSIIEVSKDLKFIIDGIEVKFQPIHKTIYLFFLLHANEKIRASNLVSSNYSKKLLKIHSLVKKGGSEKAIYTLLGLEYNDGHLVNSNLGDLNKDLLKDYRHDIFKILNSALGRAKSEYFRIDSYLEEKGHANLLSLDSNQINIDNSILLLLKE